MAQTSKESIKSHATKLFVEKTFSGTSIREIAEAASVNVAAINYHFGSKENLLTEIFNEFSKIRVETLGQILRPPSNLQDCSLRLKLFMEQYIAYVLEEPAQSDLIFQHIDLFAKKSPKSFQKMFGSIHDQLLEFFNDSQQQGYLRSDISSNMILRLFMGTLTDVVRSRKIGKLLYGISIEDQKFRESYINAIMECFIFGAKERES